MLTDFLVQSHSLRLSYKLLYFNNIPSSRVTESITVYSEYLEEIPKWFCLPYPRNSENVSLFRHGSLQLLMNRDFTVHQSLRAYDVVRNNKGR